MLKPLAECYKILYIISLTWEYSKSQIDSLWTMKEKKTNLEFTILYAEDPIVKPYE